jgi:histidine triad (HIT) family protein
MTTERKSDDSCPFCLIVAAGEPAREVLRTDRVVAFFPNTPAVLGHTLIVSRDHVRDIWARDRQTGYDLAMRHAGSLALSTRPRVTQT